MANITPEKVTAQEEANQRTDWEQQRIDYYLGLRYNFILCNVDDWLNFLYEQQKEVFKEKKKPSSNQVRKEAGIGFWENVFASISGKNKKSLDEKKAKAREKLQLQIDEFNSAEWKRCNAHNERLSEHLNNKLNRLLAGKSDTVEEYFSFALDMDSFALDGNKYRLNYNLFYDPEKKQLIIDYELPEMDKVSRVKAWKVDKNYTVVPKEMNKTDYLDMYERVLFDLSLRTVGILFESDTYNVINSIVFNGSCLYNDWQEMPTILISFEMPKKQYSYNRIKRMDCVSKVEISKLKETRYLDDIRSQKAPNDLWGTPPGKLVKPIRSSFR